MAAGVVALLILGVGASQALGILGEEGSHRQVAAAASQVGGGGEASTTGATLGSTTTTVPLNSTAEVPATTTVPLNSTTEVPTTSTVAHQAPGLHAPSPQAPTTTPTPTTTTAPLPAANGTDTNATDVVNAMNQDRAANGLAPLTPDPQLTSLAQSWANHLAIIGTIDHQDLEGLRATSLSNWQSLGENTIDGPENMSASEMETVWMSDVGHRENILRAKVNFVGVGVARDGAGLMWVVVDFGRR